MLRQRSTSVLRCALQYGLQQPGQQQQQQQQACVQVLQVLSLQAVRFRSKPSNPKNRNSQTRADNYALSRKRAIEKALSASTPPPTAGPATTTAAAAAAAGADVASVDDAGPSIAAADTQPSAAADSTGSSSEASTTSSSSSWTPQWLRSFIGDTRRRRGAPPPASASPLTPSTAVQSSKDIEQQGQQAEKQAKEKEKSEQAQSDGWEHLETFKDYSLDDYGNQIRNDPKSDDFEAPPRPRTPMRGPFAYYNGNAFDQMRVTYLRFEQHHSIIGAMLPKDKLVVKLNPNIHKDPQALQQLADSTGYSTDQLRDLFSSFHKHRRDFQLLYKFRQDGGQLPPQNDEHAVGMIKKQLRKQDDAEALKSLLAQRDVANCGLRKKAEVSIRSKAQMRQMCPQTNLPFQECCGRKIGFAVHSKGKRQLLHAQ